MVILAMTLFGMKPPSDAGSALGFATVMVGTLAGFAFLAVSLGFWRFGVRHYTSTGS